MKRSPLLVVGNGAWGFALATVLCQVHEVVVVSDNQKKTNYIEKYGHHPLFPNTPWSKNMSIIAFKNVKHYIQPDTSVLIAVSSFAFRGALTLLMPYLTPSNWIAWGTKGIECESKKIMHDVALSLGFSANKLCVISGPSFASEVLQKRLTAFTLSSVNKVCVQHWFNVFGALDFVYCDSTQDIVGVCWLGCLKNMLALMGGICKGLELGVNSSSALIARGIGEIEYFLKQIGSDSEILFKSAGIGDIILTCLNESSRNYQLGKMIAQGIGCNDALSKINQIAEGYHIAKLLDLDREHFPILKGVQDIVIQNKDPQCIIKNYFNSPLKLDNTEEKHE